MLSFKLCFHKDNISYLTQDEADGVNSLDLYWNIRSPHCPGTRQCDVINASLLLRSRDALPGGIYNSEVVLMNIQHIQNFVFHKLETGRQSTAQHTNSYQSLYNLYSYATSTTCMPITPSKIPHRKLNSRKAS